jgi:nitroreductase
MTPSPDSYDRFLALVKARHTCRGFKPDPIPDDAIDKILEAGRWAMSGANSQPWEFIVVRKPETIRTLYKTYQDEINDLNFWLEQRFPWELRHPGFRIDGDLETQSQTMNARVGWSERRRSSWCWAMAAASSARCRARARRGAIRRT